LALRLADRAAATIDRPDLVWSGPEAPGLHARDTAVVYEELVELAERMVWLSTYAFYDGRRAFRTLAMRLDETPSLRVALLLNIGRRHGDSTPADDLVLRFAERFWSRDWPGERRPDVFYDPRSVEADAAGSGGVLHAKAVVVDDHLAFVTSANLTEAAFHKNIEVGVLSRDRQVAASLAHHFRVLVERGLVSPLPAS
jgi:phosphatidylserine/phosphatidylglycerophosphate/cardiolipin synthase-like enzyme